MNPKALIGAVGGAFLGAMLWGGVAYITGYNIGWVAWGVGALVGLGAWLLGGKGNSMGAICALLTVAAIFAGHVLAYKWALQQKIDANINQKYNLDVYETLKRDSADFAKLTAEAQYPEFMVTHGYAKQGTKAAQITPKDVEKFKIRSVPQFKSFTATQPSYKEWKKSQSGDFFTGIDNVTLINAATGRLRLMDFLFAIFGIASAFKIGSGREEKE